jgi:hypothetical protein
MASPWPKLQRRNGIYPNWIGGNSRYAEALLGYALLQRGVRERDRRLINSGLRGVTIAVKRSRRARESVFENFAVASAYNLARRSLSRNRTFRRVRARWQAFLRGVTPVSLFYYQPSNPRYGNHYVVEAVGMLELFRTGLSSGQPLAALGGARGRARDGTLRMLLKVIPRLAASDRKRALGAQTFLFSDRPDSPLAYQGLSFAMYARALELLRGAATRRARTVLQQVARASWVLTAPDGDSGYFGRSQEESWALAGAAAGSEAAARAKGSSAAWDRRFRAVADRSLARLRDDYGVGSRGLNIVPALREGRRGRAGVDGSPQPAFSGLTLLLTDWALDEMARGRRSVGALAADRPLRTLVGATEARFAVVRKGPLWMAVRKTKSVDRSEDFRYDFGLIAFKGLREGRWSDVLRIRPKRLGRPDSAGPLLKRRGTGLPFGSRIRVARDGTVSINGGFRTASGRLLRRGVRFSFRPSGACVRMGVAVRAGDRIEQSFFLRSRARPVRRTATSLTDGDQSITASLPFRARIGGDYTSAVDATLDRARLTFKVKRRDQLVVQLCPA